MNPFYFGSSREPLFGVYHPPVTMGVRESAILICPPLGREYIRTHWALRRLADQLAQAGSHVLRFDYFGNGDSAGKSDEGNVERWQDDIRTAANELLELSGVRQISIVALRAGAALAATTSKLNARSLVLWDPVINGRAYLNNLQRVHRIKLEAYNRIRSRRIEATPDEMLGFPLPQIMRASIEQLNLLSGFSIESDTIFIFCSKATDELMQLQNMLKQRESKYYAEIINDAGDWDQASKVGDAFMPSGILTAVVERLGGK